MSNKKEVTPEKTPANAIPYRKVNKPFRFQFVIPGKGIQIEEDGNGNLYISSEGGGSVLDLVAGDNISLNRRDDGKIVISVVDTIRDISAGQNVSVDVDPSTGNVIISSSVDGTVSEHYKGVFDTTRDLIGSVPSPVNGDYGMVRKVLFSDGGNEEWTGEYKYCFYINGVWQIVDQMLTFTENISLINKYYSLGGGSPTVYMHEVARTGDFFSLRNIPIVETPVLTFENGEITAVCQTEGAEIHFTNDGSMPHAGSNIYSFPISVIPDVETKWRFVGVKNGMINSKEAVIDTGYALDIPVITLDWQTGIVSMENPNGSGTILFTTDGSDPGGSSTIIYNEPFHITGATRFLAKVYDYENLDSSPIAEVFFPKASSPSAFQRSYLWTEGTLRFALECRNTRDPQIRYTNDGSDPSWDSFEYAGPVALDIYRNGTESVIKAVSFAPGHVPSDVSEFYSIYDYPSMPSIRFDDETHVVTLSPTNETLNIPDYRREIHFWLTNDNGDAIYPDGSLIPEGVDPVLTYQGPFEIRTSSQIMCVLVAYENVTSSVSEWGFDIVPEPVITLDSNTGLISIQPLGEEDWYTYYTKDDGEEAEYTGPFAANNGRVTKVSAYYSGPNNCSAMRVVEFKPAPYTASPLPVIDYTVGAMRFTPPLSIGGIVRYALGSVPTSESPVAPNPLSVPLFNEHNPVQVFFRVFQEGYVPTSMGYQQMGSVKPDAPYIEIDELGENYFIRLTGNTTLIPLQTNNNVPSIGARVYYTIDGSIPTADNGILWDGNPIDIGVSSTIKAVTVCYGSEYSEVTTYEDQIDYFTLTAEEDNVTVYIASEKSSAPNFEYRMGHGDNFEPVEFTLQSGTHIASIELKSAGDSVSFRGNNPAGLSVVGSDGRTGITYFYFENRAAASGNIQTLVDYDEPTLVAKRMPGLFKGCVGLTSAPDLPATTIEHEYCYAKMFLNCTNLMTAPSLPATTLARYCYREMFCGCIGLTTAPTSIFDSETTLSDYCCEFMFSACTSLTTAPELPATTLASNCYKSMFNGCSSLTTAPALPATTLANGCYYQMFSGCTSLTTAPALPATTLASNCYYQMFSACTSLTTAPALPATTLANSCYTSMFNQCNNLTVAPYLPATTLESYCYAFMFSDCTNLSYIICLAENGITPTNVVNWVNGVAAIGTFVKSANATWATGNGGIPSGWTVQDA